MDESGDVYKFIMVKIEALSRIQSMFITQPYMFFIDINGAIFYLEIYYFGNDEVYQLFNAPSHVISIVATENHHIYLLTTTGLYTSSKHKMYRGGNPARWEWSDLQISDVPLL